MRLPVISGSPLLQARKITWTVSCSAFGISPSLNLSSPPTSMILKPLDMTEDKNRFPHDFKRWHDIRIDQYATKKAIEDEEKRKELYIQFAAVAEKYLSLQQSFLFSNRKIILNH